MISVPPGTVARPASPVVGRGGLLDRYFYFAMSLLVAAIVVCGFSRSINDNLIHPAIPRPGILWFHAVAFFGWVVFFIVQSTLIRTHHVRWHRALGWFGVALGTAMVPLGVTTAIVMARFDTARLHMADAGAFLIIPLFDMVAFAVCLALAIAWRRRPEWHRRMIVVATCGLLGAAFGRFEFISTHSLTFLGVDAVMLLGVVRDLVVNGRVHVVYRVALPVLIAFQSFVLYTFLSSSPWWITIAHAIMG
jgi:hypothetical protein